MWHVAPELITIIAHHEHHLAVRLQSDHAVDHVDPGTLELLRPLHVRRLIEAGLDLDEHATCLPRSAAFIRLRMIALSPPARYSVILIDCTFEIVSGLRDELLDAA